MDSLIIPPELLLAAYRSGIFPMAEGRNDVDIFWIDPQKRAILPLDGFHCSRSLAKELARDRFTVTCNAAFAQVLDACAAPRPQTAESWISGRIKASYLRLHELGHAHSIECWRDGRLAGGLYGVGFDGVFCGESMFSHATNASKVALAWLVMSLRFAGAQVLDCQFLTPHLASLGAIEISREEYRRLLIRAQQPGPTRPISLPDGYGALLSAAGVSAGAAGSAEGGGVAGGAAGADDGDEDVERGAASPAGGLSVASSPGKFIAQSLTQTS